MLDIKSKPNPKNTNGKKKKAGNTINYFTLGSIEDEVIEVMGEPQVMW